MVTESGYTLTLNLTKQLEVSGLLHSIDQGEYNPPVDNEVSYTVITGETEDRLEEVMTYNLTQPYTEGVNGVLTATTEYVVYEIDEVRYTTLLETKKTYYEIGMSGLNVDNSIARFVIKREADVFVGKNNTVDKIEIDRSEFSVFESMFRIAKIDSLDDFENYF
jgi:hypothetical protein